MLSKYMDAKKRRRVSWIVSIAFHLIAALVIGLTGLLHFTSLENSDIFEVQAVESGGSQGGGGADSGSIDESAPQPAENSEQEAFTPEQIGSDAILQHSDTSKTNVTYEQLDELQRKEEAEQAQEASSDTSAASNSPSQATGSVSAISTGAGSGAGEGNASGTGSGQGDGSGDGDGQGQGDGNGNGQGDGVGEATDEVVSNPAQRPELVSAASPRYPQDAINAGIEGRVVIRFLVGKDGSVESAEIAASSGHSSLDQAAMDTAYSWHFSPARDEYGRAVRCYVRIPIPFQLR